MFYKTVFVSAVVIAVIAPVFTVKQCYTCEYFDHNANETYKKANEKCKDSPPPNEFLRTCSETIGDGMTQPSDWQCALVRGRIEIDEENFDLVSRRCVQGKLHDTKCKDVKSYQTNFGFIKRGSECICDDKDGCNSGSRETLGIIMLGLGLLASQLWKV